MTSYLGIEYIEIQVGKLDKLNILFLSDLPIIGPLFSQDIVVFSRMFSKLSFSNGL